MSRSIWSLAESGRLGKPRFFDARFAEEALFAEEEEEAREAVLLPPSAADASADAFASLRAWPASVAAAVFSFFFFFAFATSRLASESRKPPPADGDPPPPRVFDEISLRRFADADEKESAPLLTSSPVGWNSRAAASLSSSRNVSTSGAEGVDDRAAAPSAGFGVRADAAAFFLCCSIHQRFCASVGSGFEICDGSALCDGFLSC